MIRSNAAGGREEESPPRPDPSRVILATLAGPALIMSSVLFQLRGFAFGGLISLQHKDVVAFWLPTYCLMGKTVSAGDVPGWNPYVMTGVPLAADPQSGWMSIIPMVLFPTTSCGTAIRWLIVVLPILAGLGLFAFLRSEGLSRIAGTVGGLSLAMTIASSRLGLSVPFAMAIAWSAVALWAASRLVRAVDGPSRFAWIAATSLAWGQIVAAHPSNGQLIGSGALACFLLAKGIVLVRERGIGLRSLLVVLALLGASMIAVNLAILLPRGAYLGRTGLSLGYDTLGDGTLGVSAEGLAIGASWPLKLSVVPGAYLGSIVLALAGAGLWSARWRHLAIAFAAFATVYYLLSLDVVYRLLAPILHNVPLADQLYLHQPWRFGLALILALPILGALGVESSLRAQRESCLVSLWMVVPGVVVWVLGTALVAPADRMALFVGGLVVCGGSLLWLSRRPALLGFVPFLLAVELLVNGAVGLSSSSRPSDLGSDVYAARFLYGPLLRPTIPARRYLTEPAFVDPIRAADRRYLTFGHYHQSAPRFWPALGDQRGIVFGIEDANGYNPAQPIRYWRFNRAINRAWGMPLGKYNVSALRALAPSAIDLLDVGWVISRKKAPAASWVSPVAEDRGWVLSIIEPAHSRASIPERWDVLSEPEALRQVSDPTFDPALTLVLEADPGVSRGHVEGARADFEWTGLASARVTVSTTADAVVLIRNGYDPYWHATLDGRETPILVGDYFLQAVPVPTGSHTIELRYRDPWVGLGAASSTLTLVILFGLTLGLRRRASQGDLRGCARFGDA